MGNGKDLFTVVIPPEFAEELRNVSLYPGFEGIVTIRGVAGFDHNHLRIILAGSRVEVVETQAVGNPDFELPPQVYWIGLPPRGKMIYYDVPVIVTKDTVSLNAAKARHREGEDLQ